MNIPVFLEYVIVHSMVERDELVLAETNQGSKTLELGYRSTATVFQLQVSICSETLVI